MEDGQFQLGDWRVDIFECGRLALDGGAMFGSVPRVVWQRRIAPDSAHRIPLAMRLLLLRRDDATVLVDTGIGDKFDQTFRDMFAVENPVTTVAPTPLLQALADFGVTAEQITHVVLTHLHFDHGGGTTRRGVDGVPSLTFPNAEHFLQSANWETANDPNPRERASYLRDNFAPLAGGRLTLLDGASELLPGLQVLPSHGHTAGMQTLRLEGGGQVLHYLADLAPTRHHLHLPFTMGYDLSALEIMREKEALLPQAVAEDAIIVFEHDPQLAAGRIGMDGGKFAIVEELVCGSS
ncbi:MAG: MBL fold metallo-hydrolase [Planctomycetota bacterium]